MDRRKVILPGDGNLGLKVQREGTTGSMGGAMPHAGQVPCHRSKEDHAKWRWGKKKGMRRARRRMERSLCEDTES